MKYLALVLGLITMGCATKYKPVGFTGGYEDSQLSKDIFEVSFHGNGFTNKDKVKKMLIRRCAELTKNNGFDYFAFINQENETNHTNVRTEHRGDLTTNYYTGTSNYRGQTTTSSTPKHDSRGTIKMFKSGEQPPDSLEASIILRQYE